MEDLQWTIPEKVSNVQVDEASIEGETTPQQTSQGESNDPLIGWVLRYPAYAKGLWGIIYYMQVRLQIGIAWLCELWYRILLIGMLMSITQL